MKTLTAPIPGRNEIESRHVSDFSQRLLRFKTSFLHPRVSIFFLLGTMIIFLTFLTTDNALEIAISGVASVFIGIGVNNFTSVETKGERERQTQRKLEQVLSVLDLSRTKAGRMRQPAASSPEKTADLAELEQLIILSIHLAEELQKTN